MREPFCPKTAGFHPFTDEMHLSWERLKYIKVYIIIAFGPVLKQNELRCSTEEMRARA
jgi:hypothetical protein